MTISDKGIDLICEFEGFSECPYVDPATKAEPITIGYGTTVYPSGIKVTMQDEPITKEQGKEFIKHHIESKIAPNLVDLELTQNQYDSVCSLIYNIGYGNFKSSTVLRLIRSGNYTPETMRSAFCMWNKANHVEMKGLTIRRNKEADLFLTV